MINIPCVIFAGGKSSRMKKDKALLDFKGKPLALYQYERMEKIFTKVYISTKEDKFNFQANFLFDKSKIFAPTPIIEEILTNIGDFFALSVDTPFIDEEIIHQILLHSFSYDATIAKTSFTHPLVGVYRKSFLPTLQKQLKNGNYKLNSILKMANVNFITFKDGDKFLNCNYPYEFQEALKKIC
jgi:molybdopterin-guanine dinucleotide biosynthesis protein A